MSAMAAALGELAEADVENCANTLEISRVTSLLARLLSQHPGLPTSEEVACSLGETPPPLQKCTQAM